MQHASNWRGQQFKESKNMKYTMFMLIIGAFASMALPRMASSFTQNQNNKGFSDKDEFTKTFELTPGARVEVSSIRGSVEIETADVKTAEVHVVRSAKTREDLSNYQIEVQGGQGSLIVRGETRERKSGSGMNPDVQHWVKLILPRQIDLSVQGVSGGVKTGDVSGKLSVNNVSGSLDAGSVVGQVYISSVSGSVSLGPVNQGADIKSVSGNVDLEQASGPLSVIGVSGAVSAGISKLGQSGVDIKTVSGRVELRFKEEVNAQLSTNNISGKLSLDIPNVTVQSRGNASAVRALIGKGGPQISISSVSSDVRLAPGS